MPPTTPQYPYMDYLHLVEQQLTRHHQSRERGLWYQPASAHQYTIELFCHHGVALAHVETVLATLISVPIATEWEENQEALWQALTAREDVTIVDRQE